MNYPRNMLIQRVREEIKGHFQSVGVFVGINDNGVIRCGFSKCHLPPTVIPEKYLVLMREDVQLKYRKGVINSDTFNLQRGISEACRHIFAPIEVPRHGREFARKYADFRFRCMRYFKDAQKVQALDGIVYDIPKDIVRSLKKVPVIAPKKSARKVLINGVIG